MSISSAVSIDAVFLHPNTVSRRTLHPEDWHALSEVPHPEDAPHFQWQYYDTARRKKEGVYKKIIAIFNGLGMMLGVVGGLTLAAPFAPILVGLEVICATSAIGAAVGGLIGYFSQFSKIEKDNLSEAEAVAAYNKSFFHSQLALIKEIERADALLIDKLNHFIQKWCPESSAKLQCLRSNSLQAKWDYFLKNRAGIYHSSYQYDLTKILVAADSVLSGIESLQFIDANDNPCIRDASLGMVTCKEMNAHTHYLKQHFSTEYHLMLTPFTRAAIQLNHLPNLPEAAVPTPTLTFGEKLKQKIAKAAIAINSVSGAAGTVFGIGAIVASIFLISNPLGWMTAGCILGGSLLGAAILGGVQLYTEYHLCHDQELRMDELGTLAAECRQKTHEHDELTTNIRECFPHNKSGKGTALIALTLGLSLKKSSPSPLPQARNERIPSLDKSEKRLMPTLNFAPTIANRF